MKDYIKFYKYDADYQAAKANLPVPHAVYCWETNITDISEPLWNEKQYLAFQAVDGDATVTIENVGGAAPQLEYSYNQVDWTDWTAAGYGEIPIESNKKVYIRGINGQIGYSSSKYSRFGGTGNYNISGSISSLLNGDDIFGNLTLSKTHTFYKLFNKNTSIINADKLLLPYDVLKNYCYYSMFLECTNLTSAPELPATTLASYCYAYIFNECTSLVTAPALPATVLKDYCYHYMFYDCFSLVTAPVLPATILVNNCYSFMFYGCTKLTNIESHAGNVTGTFYWTYNVSSTGTFRCYSTTVWERGVSGIPTNWTIEYLD